ncbi:MAG: transglutaminase domain-containing protein [Bacteroidetes bacterium]|nr:transglutaminase domain-containing protein [Bacteroidota bacterium]
MSNPAPAHRLTLLMLVLRLLTLVLPTALAGTLVLYQANISYTALDTGILTQAAWFSGALAVSYIIFVWRGRFIIFTPLLLLGLWITSRIIRGLPGEFDVFVAVARFDLIQVLILTGWLIGWILNLSRWLLVIPAGIFLTVTLVSISHNAYNALDLSPEFLLRNLLPTLLWVMYMLFMAPALQDLRELNGKQTLQLSLRTVGFVALVILAFFIVTETFRGTLKEKQGEITQKASKEGKNQDPPDGENQNDKGKNGGQKRDKNNNGYNERKGLLERPVEFDENGKPIKPKPGDDGLRLKDTMQMDDQMSRNDYVMFCARLDNFFPDGMPKPLYFAYHHLSLFDPQKEQFMRDAFSPMNDEMNADPVAIPLYNTVTDSSVIRKSMAAKKRRVIEAEVYMASNTWKHALLAPSAAFSVQSIAIDKGFDTSFQFAYRVKSYATTLTTTYAMEKAAFKPNVAKAIQDSYEELNTVSSYAGTDPAVYKYFTAFPVGVLFDSIRMLAEKIVRDAGAKTPLEKVDAIDQYFRSKDASGNPLYRYTLNPGKKSDPNIPTATMLGNFLFKTHAGYCTYYAGATVLMLRAIGVPARFTTGFATIDRSDKNKGWYWFYGRQAHAWTQVYFPGYGWIDFDTTVGNSDQQDAPRPDGTPPLPPPRPWLVVHGVAETAAQNKKVKTHFSRVNFHNNEYLLNGEAGKVFDVSLCRVKYGLKDTTLAALLPNDSVVIVCYNSPNRKIAALRNNISLLAQMQQLDEPVIADELHIKPRPEPKKPEPKKPEPKKPGKKEPLDIPFILWLSGGFAAGLLLLLFLLPFLVWLWMRSRVGAARTPKERAHRIYRLALFTFHQTVAERGNETPLDYARQKIDPALHTGFENFMHTYLRLKYAAHQTTETDEQQIRAFWPAFVKATQKNAGNSLRWWLKFLQLAKAQRFLRRPHSDQSPDSTA